jgi:lipopolysaccharide transport system permease protein
MELQYFWVQIKELTLASLKSRYRKTWAGFIWVILNPLLMFGVQSLVFRKIMKIAVADYYLFLLGGLLPWIFLTSTIQMGTPVFVNQGQLLKSFKINPWVVLGAQVLDCFINFLVSFFIIILPFYLTSDKSIFSLLLLPVAFLPLFVATLSMTIALSILNVFHRDINFVVGFIFSLLFFLTPIFYPKEYVPEEFQLMVLLNPLVHLIEPFRLIIHTNSSENFLGTFLKSAITASALAGIAIIVWKKKQNDFYQKL